MWLYLLLALPSFAIAALGQSSFSGGMAITSAAVLFFLITHEKELKISKIYLKFFAISTISVVFSMSIFGYPGVAKQVLSLPLLVVFGLAYTYSCSKLFTQAHFLKTQITTSFYVATILGFAAAFNLTTFLLPGLNRATFPFSEPSQFALSYAIISTAMATLVSGYKRWSTALTVLVLAATFPNTTLLMIAVLISALLLSRLREYLILALVLSVFALVLIEFPDLMHYYTSRIMGSDNDNLSRLVYLQGWESAYSALASTKGLGVGFQNLGVEPVGQSTILIRAIFEGNDLNRTDGGFLAAKIIGEFGVVGMGIVAAISFYALKSFFWLRKMISSGKREYSEVTFLHSTIYIFVIELFVRGGGYFSPSCFVFLWAVGRLFFLKSQLQGNRSIQYPLC